MEDKSAKNLKLLKTQKSSRDSSTIKDTFKSSLVISKNMRIRRDKLLVRNPNKSFLKQM
jgi:hypothetical protein